MPRLIVNADDFGLTGGINRAIGELYAAGGLTSATLMAAAPRFEQAIALAKQHPALGVGCHIVLLDGSPVSDPASIASLLARPHGTGGAPAFRPTLGHFVRDLWLGRIRPEHIEREAIAQIRRMQQAGVRVTHVDTHKHTHMFPQVLEAVSRAAVVCGVRAVRNPFEPAWSVAATPDAGMVRKLQVRALARYRGRFFQTVRNHNLATTDGCLGVLATGTLDERTLHSILDRAPVGTWELVCHPGHLDDELRGTRTRLQQSRETELAALRAMATWPKPGRGSMELIHFGALAKEGSAN